MIEWDKIEQALSTLVPVTSGTSTALRGVVTLAGGAKAFVKIATNDHTHHSIKHEISTYHWLEQAGYEHVPRLLAESPSGDGLALPDLSAWDWRHVWSEAKLDAALSALDVLAGLPNADKHFEQSHYSPYPGNPWQRLPNDARPFAGFIDAGSLQEIDTVLANKALHSEYQAIADHEPWRGNELVHYDARADNFAYDTATNHGRFVDWNWSGLGSRAFDQTALLVTVQLAGFDIFPNYRHRIDHDSLIWLMGFWLERGLGPQDTEGRKLLRPRQVANAIQAHELLARL